MLGVELRDQHFTKMMEAAEGVKAGKAKDLAFTIYIYFILYLLVKFLIDGYLALWWRLQEFYHRNPCGL